MSGTAVLTAQAPPPEPPEPPAPPLTGVVIAPGWALAYGSAVLGLNVGLQAASRSEAVLAPLRAAFSALPIAGTSARALALALLVVAVTVVSYGLMLVPAAVLAVTAHRHGVSFAEAVGLRRFRAGQTALLVAAVVVGGFVVTIAYASIANALGMPVQGNTAELVAGFRTGPLEMALAFVLVGIVAPFVEEITFRGIVFPSLRSAWGTAPALLASGAMFGVVHLQPAIAVPLALIGIALAAIFLRTRSLWTSILAHCAYNSVALALAFALAR